MAFPQVSSNKYVQDGARFYRLTTPLASPGDVYELTSSVNGIIVGPDSDLANLQVTYFDDEVAASLTNSFHLSPLCPFPATLNRREDTDYPISQRKGRILISSQDIYDPEFRPTGFDPVNDEMNFIAPVLDVIGFFQVPPLTPAPKRSDKTFYFQNLPFSSGLIWVVVPFYGRKYAFIDIRNWNASDPNTINISAVNFSTTDPNASTTTGFHLETPIAGPIVLAAAGGAYRGRILASSLGMFDAIILSYSATGPVPTKIIMSDDAL